MVFLKSKWVRVFAVCVFFFSVLYLAGLELKIILDLPTALFLLAGTFTVTSLSYKKGMPIKILIEKAKRNCIIIGGFGLFIGLLAALTLTDDMKMLPRNIAVDMLIVPYTVLFYFGLDFIKSCSDGYDKTQSDIGISVCESNSLTKYNLTDREIDIIKSLLSGKGNREIAEELYITESTVKKHISNIYRKIGVKSRHELVCLFGTSRA